MPIFPEAVMAAKVYRHVVRPILCCWTAHSASFLLLCPCLRSFPKNKSFLPFLHVSYQVIYSVNQSKPNKQDFYLVILWWASEFNWISRWLISYDYFPPLVKGAEINFLHLLALICTLGPSIFDSTRGWTSTSSIFSSFHSLHQFYHTDNCTAGLDWFWSNFYVLSIIMSAGESYFSGLMCEYGWCTTIEMTV